jgi:hypothetical protein
VSQHRDNFLGQDVINPHAELGNPRQMCDSPHLAGLLKGRLFRLIPAGDKIRIPQKKGAAANHQQRRDIH